MLTGSVAERQLRALIEILVPFSHGWRGMTMTPRATRRLQDLRRQLFADQSETDLGETVTAAA
jgi:predicted alpha/beta-fold hydrolase